MIYNELLPHIFSLPSFFTADVVVLTLNDYFDLILINFSNKHFSRFENSHYELKSVWVTPFRVCVSSSVVGLWYGLKGKFSCLV